MLGLVAQIHEFKGKQELYLKQKPAALEKVRTKDVPNNGIELVKGEKFTIPNECFNYPDFHRHLKPGMTAWANG